MPLSSLPLPRTRTVRRLHFVASMGAQSRNPCCGKLSSPLCMTREKVGPAYWCVSSPKPIAPAEGACHDQPVAGVMPVPAHEAMSQHPASRQPRRRFPALGTRRPVAPDLPPTAPSLESPALSTGSMYLTVLVSMPTPLAHGKARQGRGPPVVELGVAQVTYTPNVS
jgi:hypothetical protein